MSLGHTLVIPKTKYTKFDTIPPHIAAALGKSVNLIAKAIKKATGINDYNILQNNGKAAHQEVPHCHFHIIPKSNAGGLGVVWNSSKNEDPEDIQSKIVQAIVDIQNDQAEEAAAAAGSEHRLPQTVQPRNYKLTLSPDLEKFTFDGVLHIEADVLTATTTIVMHAKELEVSSAVVTDCFGKSI